MSTTGNGNGASKEVKLVTLTIDDQEVSVPEGTNLEDYTTVLVWCEAFSEFITSARYR